MKNENLLNIEIGKTLRGLRLNAGMTQTKVAQYIGVTFQQIQKYEKGTNALSITKFVRFCNLFEISGDKLLGKTGVWFRVDKDNPYGTQVKVTEVNLEQIKPKYWFKNNEEEDEQKKD